MLPMIGFEPGPSSIGSDCAVNYATATALPIATF